MRGNDLQQAGMWSYVSLEERVPHYHPPRPLRAMTDEALQQLHRGSISCTPERSTVDCAGEAIARTSAASFAVGAQRTDVDGAAQLQRAVPLIREVEHG
jgi:hypothetical protein